MHGKIWTNSKSERGTSSGPNSVETASFSRALSTLAILLVTTRHPHSSFERRASLNLCCGIEWPLFLEAYAVILVPQRYSTTTTAALKAGPIGPKVQVVVGHAVNQCVLTLCLRASSVCRPTWLQILPINDTSVVFNPDLVSDFALDPVLVTVFDPILSM